MIHIFRTTSSVLALMTLAACGGGGGGGGIAFGGDPLAVPGEALAISNEDTQQASLDRGDGLTGVLSSTRVGFTNPNPQLSAMKVTVNSSETQATVTIGGSTFTLPLLDSGATFYRFGSETGRLVQVNLAGTNSLVTFSEGGATSGISAFGYLGIETPIAELPSGPQTYTGSWGGQAYSSNVFNSGVVGGDLSLAVNFDANTVTGTFDGDLNAGTNAIFAGTVSGTTSGNGLTATMTPTSGVTGSIDIAGNAYGFFGDDIAGGVAGEITAGGADYGVSGTFAVGD